MTSGQKAPGTMRKFYATSQGTILGCAIVLLAAFLSLRVWIHLPIYPDEVAHRVWSSRFFADHFVRMQVFPICAAAFEHPTPLAYVPSAALGSLLSFTGVEWNRPIAIVALVIAGVLVAASRKSGVHPNPLAAVLAAAFFSAIFAGVLPSGYVITRPEHLIVLVIALMVFAVARGANFSAATRHCVILAIIVLLGLALYSHPKSIYLVPAAVIVAWTLSPKGLRYVYIGWLGLLVAGAFALARQFLNCPEAPDLQAFQLRFNINPLTLFTSPVQFISDVAALNFGPRWSRFFSQALIKGEYDIHYLPGMAVTRLDRLANVTTVALVAVNLTAAAAAMAILARTTLHSIRGAGAKEGAPAGAEGSSLIETRWAVTLLLCYVGVMLHLALNTTQNWYDVAFWHLSFALLNAAFWPSVLLTAVPSRLALQLSAWAMVVAALISGGLTAAKFLPPLRGGYAGPGVALNDVRPAERRAMIHKLIDACSIPSQPRHLVVDDLTYSNFQQTFEPLALTYSSYFGEAKALETFRRMGSDGLVVRCSYLVLVPSLKPRSRSEGDLCCVRFDH
jgi:hypothetical protein